MCDTNDADLPPKVTTSGDFAGLLNEQNEDPRWACNTSINTAIRSYLWQKECLNPKATIEDYFNANTDTDREEALSKLCDYCQSESDCPLIRMIRETGPFDRVGQRPVSSENARARLVTACLSSATDSCEDHRERFRICTETRFGDWAGSDVTNAEKEQRIKTIGKDFLEQAADTTNAGLGMRLGLPSSLCPVTTPTVSLSDTEQLSDEIKLVNDCLNICVDYVFLDGHPLSWAPMMTTYRMRRHSPV